MERPTLEQSIKAIADSRPPATDDITYLTIIEAHLTPELLPALNVILQDVELCQKIGWDLIHLLVPLKGSEQCLKTIARLGNPREVILQVTEVLGLLRVGDDVISDSEDEDESAKKDSKDTQNDVPDADKFATLVSMLATLHPRIKTKWPSRFLSTSMMAILAAYKPSPQSTYAVISFIQALSGKNRPQLPTRKSSMAMDKLSIAEPAKGETASDPEASAQDPGEAAIQKKLLQSFLTHVLELYVKDNMLEWSPRLLEHYRPERVISNGLRKSRCEAFREDPALQEREVVIGQIVALAKDLSLGDSSALLSLLTESSDVSIPTTPTLRDEDAHPNKPDDVPLSRAGTLFLLTTAIFSSTLFSTSHVQLPNLTLFPTYSTLLASFVGQAGPETTGWEDPSIIDALLAIGLWLEENDKFVAGPLEDEDFLQLLQSLSLISANCPDEKLRYAAHMLTGNILHAHPHDRVRLTFLSDTLEHCPYEALRASAVGWLKEELITAHKRSSSPAAGPSEGHHSPARNAFATTAAISALQPYLFPYESAMTAEKDEELWEEFQRTYLFHMAALGFLIFISQWDGKDKVVPEGTITVMEEVYLTPLREACERLEAILKGDLPGWGEHAREGGRREVLMMKERISRCEELTTGNSGENGMNRGVLLLDEI